MIFHDTLDKVKTALILQYSHNINQQYNKKQWRMFDLNKRTWKSATDTIIYSSDKGYFTIDLKYRYGRQLGAYQHRLLNKYNAKIATVMYYNNYDDFGIRIIYDIEFIDVKDEMNNVD